MIYILSSFFFNDTATTETYTLSLHDALPIWDAHERKRLYHEAVAFLRLRAERLKYAGKGLEKKPVAGVLRSEEHTSELQSRQYLVCRLLLEKKKKARGRVAEQE